MAREGIVLDLGPVVELVQAIDAVEEVWRRVPAGARKGLSRLIWLAPDGQVIPYRAPQEDPGAT